MGQHFNSLHLADVELLRELVQDGAVGVLVLLHHRGDQSNQVVPELKVIKPWPGILVVPPVRLPLALPLLPLELRLVQLVTIFKQELVRRAQAGLNTVK